MRDTGPEGSGHSGSLHSQGMGGQRHVPHLSNPEPLRASRPQRPARTGHRLQPPCHLHRWATWLPRPPPPALAGSSHLRLDGVQGQSAPCRDGQRTQVRERGGGAPSPSSSHPDLPRHEAAGALRPGGDSCLATTRDGKGWGPWGAVGEAEQPPDAGAS